MNTIKNSFLTLPIALLVACADPSENVPKADVSATNQPVTASAAPSAAAKTYMISADNSKVEFTGSKVTGKHDGGFKQLQGEIRVNGNAVSQAKVTIDTTSIWSDNDRLTGHLKSPDFFDVQKFPTAAFETTSITGSGDSSTITGNLTLHGVTKQITFPAKIGVKGDQVTVNAEFAINRFDFGIKYPGKTDDLIRENVVLRLDVKATPQAG